MSELDADYPELTERQVELLGLLARGFNVGRIAVAWSYSIGYTYAEVKALRETMDVATNAAAVVEALRMGVIELPPQGEMIGCS